MSKNYEKNENDEFLNPSELGTKQYWDSVYCKEIDNFEDHQDVGDIWFGKALLQKILQWLDSKEGIKKEDPILDLGCGNGWTLITLAKLGYKNLVGVDYSDNAVELAHRIAEAECLTDVITYKVCDLVSDCGFESFDNKFKVAFDKGTYDAICLSQNGCLIQRDKYKTNVAKCLKNSGFFIISSCNWTEEELKDFFKNDFDFIEAIPPPKTFQFGGKMGNNYSTVVLQRKI